MSNGWSWFEEGKRRGAEAAARRDTQVAYEGELDYLKAAQVEHQEAEPAPAVGGFVGDLAELVREVELCRAGHCEAAYKQNSIGGDARGIVASVANVAGVNLGASHEGPRPLDGNVWSVRNMTRVVQAVQQLTQEHEALRQELAGRDQNDRQTVAALHEALTHLGEAV
ncbi:hypothetical protein [Streptomyces sp. NPDC002547]